jgi:hypothetical protein
VRLLLPANGRFGEPGYAPPSRLRTEARSRRGGKAKTPLRILGVRATFANVHGRSWYAQPPRYCVGWPPQSAPWLGHDAHCYDGAQPGDGDGRRFRGQQLPCGDVRSRGGWSPWFNFLMQKRDFVPRERAHAAHCAVGRHGRTRLHTFCCLDFQQSLMNLVS